jgi:hypothetical protein
MSDVGTILAYVRPTGLLFKQQCHENVRLREKFNENNRWKDYFNFGLDFIGKINILKPLPGPIHRTPIENLVHNVTTIFEKKFWVSFSRF